ncbi:MAG: hypothetical protein R3358_04680 [Woeseiaceae bacterium]|nr:hypothetical protein [Woeseiaceae bacterium]
MTDSASFVSELQRRHVVRAAIAHIFVGWLFVQFADVVLPYLGFEGDAVRWALVISVATFPVTIVVAWLFEHPWQQQTRSRLATDLVVIAAVVAFAWGWAYRNLPHFAEARTSVVILPFEHSGDSREQGLSRAIAYEVASLLMRTRAIDVVGVESAASPVLAGLGAMGAAERLNVSNALSGSVALEGDAMRIELELQDQSGKRLWDDVIEDDIGNLAAVQEQIAAAVERTLGYGEDTVSVQQVAANRCWKPNDPEALRKYYRARSDVELRSGSETSKQEVRDAIKAYRELIEQHPKFAEARSGLAWALMHQRAYDRENAEPDAHQQARALAEQALADCATLGEAMHILPNPFDHENPMIGQYQQLTAFIEMQPEMLEYYQRLTRHYWDTGLTDRAMATAQQNYALNPLSPRAIRNLAAVYQYAGNLDRAIELWEELQALGHTGEAFPMQMKKLRDCGNDVECLIRNIPESMQHVFGELPGELQPYEDRLRLIYRQPGNEDEATESIELAMQMFRAQPNFLLNWFTGAACNFDHLAPLTVKLWWEVRELWQRNGHNRPFWFWPNVWCNNVMTSPGFPQMASDAMLVEYWDEVAYPPGCRKDGNSVACEAVNAPGRK